MSSQYDGRHSDAYETRDIVVNNREDIMSEVLSHLPPGDLATCMRVCRLWYDEASRFLYRNVKLDQDSMPSFLYGLNTLCDDIEPCRATMAEGIWKDCDHETAERLHLVSQPRTFYNFKAPLLRYVQTLTLASHHRCTCAPSGPLIHRLLSNLKLLRVVRTVCGCPASCAINALCDSAACPFLNCFADKYVFRNNDGDCGAAATSRMDRHGFLYGVEGRDNRTTVVLPRTPGLLHSHGPVDIAFRSALERATSLKIVFADWEGCVKRPNAVTVTLKNARIVILTATELLRLAPRCREIIICGMERLELAATRGGEASQIDADDLRSLKKDMEDAIRKSVWIQRVLPDNMIHTHDGDIMFSFGSVPQHIGSANNLPGTQGLSDEEGAVLPGADLLNVSTLFDDDDDDVDGISDDDEPSGDSELSADDEGLSDAAEEDDSHYSSVSEGGGHETGVEDDDEEDGGEETDGHADEIMEEEEAQNFLAAFAGWIGTQGHTSHSLGGSAGAATSAHNSSPVPAANAPAQSPASGSSSANTNASPSDGNGTGGAGNVGGPAQASPPSVPLHGPGMNGQSLLAAFQEFVASLTRTEPMDGKIVFRTFDEYLADEDSRGELSP